MRIARGGVSKGRCKELKRAKFVSADLTPLHVRSNIMWAFATVYSRVHWYSKRANSLAVEAKFTGNANVAEYRSRPLCPYRENPYRKGCWPKSKLIVARLWRFLVSLWNATTPSKQQLWPNRLPPDKMSYGAAIQLHGLSPTQRPIQTFLIIVYSMLLFCLLMCFECSCPDLQPAHLYNCQVLLNPRKLRRCCSSKQALNAGRTEIAKRWTS